MEDPTFQKLLSQLRKVKLSRDKFFILEQVTTSPHNKSLWFINGKQLGDLVNSFAHSEDKREAVKRLDKRICAKLTGPVVAQIIKSASFSKDRVAILEVLVRHLKELDSRQVQLTVVGAFDFYIDKDLAWEIISKQCEANGSGSLPVIHESDEPDLLLEHPVEINSFVQNLAAQSTGSRMTVFDLPIYDRLKTVRQSLPEMRENVEREVELRKELKLNFLIPSRVYKITASLMPGQRLTGAELARYSSCPDLMNLSRSVSSSTERLSFPSSIEGRNRRDSSDSGIDHTTDSDKENSDWKVDIVGADEVILRSTTLKLSRHGDVQRRRPASVHCTRQPDSTDHNRFISSGVTGRQLNKLWR